MYMPVIDIDPKKVAELPITKAIGRTAKKMEDQGILRTTRKLTTKAFSRVLEKVQPVSDFFKKAFFYLEREWSELKKTSLRIKETASRWINESRAATLSKLIATEEEKIFNKIHGEVEMDFGALTSAARDSETKRQVLKTFEWHLELIGRKSEWGGLNGIGATFLRDTGNLIITYYLYEILCNDIPSFRLFEVMSNTDKMQTEQYIVREINKCAEKGPEQRGPDETYVEMPNVPRGLLRPPTRISPSDPKFSKNIKKLSMASAKTSVKDAPGIFKEMKKARIEDLKKVQKAVKEQKARTEKRRNLIEKKRRGTQRLSAHEKDLEAARQRAEDERMELEVLAAGPQPRGAKSQAPRSGFTTGFSAAPLQVPQPQPQPPARAGVSRGRGRVSKAVQQAPLSDGEVSVNGSPQYSVHSPYTGPR
jgi:hypothetical protein